MRRILLPALALLTAAAAPTSPGLAPADGPLMRRATLIVSDMDRALAFYRDVLGFVVHSDSVSRPTSYSYPVFDIPKQARLRFATLSDRREVRTLALTEVTGVALPKRSTPHQTAVVIEVPSVPATLAKTRPLGLKVIDPVELKGSDGLIGLEAGIVDADGNLIVIYDRSGAPKPR